MGKTRMKSRWQAELSSDESQRASEQRRRSLRVLTIRAEVEAEDKQIERVLGLRVR